MMRSRRSFLAGGLALGTSLVVVPGARGQAGKPTITVYRDPT